MSEVSLRVNSNGIAQTNLLDEFNANNNNVGIGTNGSLCCDNFVEGEYADMNTPVSNGLLFNYDFRSTTTYPGDQYTLNQSGSFAIYFAYNIENSDRMYLMGSLNAGVSTMSPGYKKDHMDFDGQTDYMFQSNSPTGVPKISGNKPFTFEATVSIDQWNSSDIIPFTCIFNSSMASGGTTSPSYNSGSFGFELTNGGNNVNMVTKSFETDHNLGITTTYVNESYNMGTPSSWLGSYHNFSWTYDGEVIRQYIDGTLMSTSTGISTFAPPDSGIGNYRAYYGFMAWDPQSSITDYHNNVDGKVKAFRLYDRALSDDEVERNSNNSLREYKKIGISTNGTLYIDREIDELTPKTTTMLTLKDLAVGLSTETNIDMYDSGTVGNTFDAIANGNGSNPNLSYYSIFATPRANATTSYRMNGGLANYNLNGVLNHSSYNYYQNICQEENCDGQGVFRASNYRKYQYGTGSAGYSIGTLEKIQKFTGGTGEFEKLNGYPWTAMAVYDGTTNGFKGIIVWIIKTSVENFRLNMLFGAPTSGNPGIGSRQWPYYSFIISPNGSILDYDLSEGKVLNIGNTGDLGSGNYGVSGYVINFSGGPSGNHLGDINDAWKTNINGVNYGFGGHNVFPRVLSDADSCDVQTTGCSFSESWGNVSMGTTTYVGFYFTSNDAF